MLGSMSSRAARLVLVEDQTIFRELLAEVLQADRSLEIAAQYSEGLAALEGCRSVQPDLVILDAVLPDIDGLEVLKQLLSWRPNLPVVMVTAHARPALVRRAVQSGARGFVRGSIFDRQGRLVASIAQEGVIRLWETAKD